MKKIIKVETSVGSVMRPKRSRDRSSLSVITKRLLSIILAFALVASVFPMLTGCPGTGPRQPGHLTLFINNGQDFDGATRDPIWNMIEEAAGVSLTFRGTTHGPGYYASLNPLMNTIQNMPDLVFSVPRDLGVGTFMDVWTAPGRALLYSYCELLARYPAGTFPWIERVLASDRFINLRHNGSQYILPLIASENSGGVYWRADWLIAVGLFDTVDGVQVPRIPTNMDEFTEAIRRFSHYSHPGNTGANAGRSTWGYCPARNEFAWETLMQAFGVTPNWDLRNGEIDYMFTTPEFRNFLIWANQMHRNGNIMPTFNAIQQGGDRDEFYSSRVGVLITNAESHTTFIMQRMANMGHAANVVMGPPPVGTANIGVPGAGGFSNFGGWWGGFSITRMCADIDGALKFLDFMYSPEGSMIRSFGVEGTHYDLVEGEIIPNNAARTANRGFEMFNGAPTGRYRLGISFGYPIDWAYWEETGDIIPKIYLSSFDPVYNHLVQSALDNLSIVSSQLTNITAFTPATTGAMVRVEDASLAFRDGAILGRPGFNLTNNWDNMVNSAKGPTWPIMTGAMLETLRELGVIT